MTLDPKSPTEGGPSQPPNEQQPEILLAKWSTRFWAWLVDAIIVNTALGVIFGIFSMPMWMYGLANPRMMSPIYGADWFNGLWGPFGFAVNSLVFFLYWTYMESRHGGQSIGKMLLHIKTTDLEGRPADVKSIAISSFGKSFILILDVLLGWIFTNDKRQRLLARAANTLVIKVDENHGGSNVKYVKE
ncbi:MAG: RDD family protein [Nitrososphaera sp.]|jgi:uncharacterized RDD family membrane protein YckC